jgi:hypothetical protein
MDAIRGVAMQERRLWQQINGWLCLAALCGAIDARAGNLVKDPGFYQTETASGTAWRLSDD